MDLQRIMSSYLSKLFSEDINQHLVGKNSVTCVQMTNDQIGN